MDNYIEDDLAMPLSKVLSIIQERVANRTVYFGEKAQKSPIDAWIYQEIIFETKPDVIIEIGNANGGGTLFLAHICDLLGRGRVIGIDLSHADIAEQVKKHPRITFIQGDACQRFECVEEQISKDDRVLVIEDSSHTYDNTLSVLRLYSTLVKPGDYFIVEDSICHHGLSIGPNPGPYEAIETFINENSDFEIDRSRESFLITWNPRGYLKRIQPTHNGLHIKKFEESPLKKRKNSMLVILRLFVPPIFGQIKSGLKIQR
ncbi:MAG: CmcI family methyltransferase [Dehalococcoidia bacterium]|jgi:cephalosporin hydroxylase